MEWLLLRYTGIASGMHTDAMVAYRSQDDANMSQETVASAGSAVGKDGAGADSAKRQATVDDIEWDDVINLWANVHACYIEKDRSILADAKRCVSNYVHASLGAFAYLEDGPGQPCVCTLNATRTAPKSSQAISYCVRSDWASYVHSVAT